jgi:pimeloyl-ACP methyl ester carboxylesterase
MRLSSVRFTADLSRRDGEPKSNEVSSAAGGSGTRPPLIILHGLFGRKRNWRSVARELSRRGDVWTVDLRSHGESPVGELSFEALAEDLREFIEEQRLGRPVVLGHSLGGKAAFEYVRRYPAGASGLVIADVTPFAIPDEVCRGLRTIAEALLETDLGAVSSRGEAQKLLASRVGGGEIAAFLLQNAERGQEKASAKGGFRWREGARAAARQVSEVCRGVLGREGADASRHASAGRAGQSSRPGWTGPVLLVRGGSSAHFPESDREDFFRLFPAAEERVIEGAGHWLHISHRAEFIAHVERFLDSL